MGSVPYHFSKKKYECFDYFLFRGVKQPITDLDRPSEFQEVETPRFKDNRHMKVAKLSAL
jgi:hypothetical protein